MCDEERWLKISKQRRVFLDSRDTSSLLVEQIERHVSEYFILNAVVVVLLRELRH